jgi:hypothetical protein
MCADPISVGFIAITTEDPDEVVKTFREENSPEFIEQTVREIRRFLLLMDGMIAPYSPRERQSELAREIALGVACVAALSSKHPTWPR